MNRAGGGIGSLINAYADLENGDFTPPPSTSSRTTTKSTSKAPARKPASSSSTKSTKTTTTTTTSKAIPKPAAKAAPSKQTTSATSAKTTVSSLPSTRPAAPSAKQSSSARNNNNKDDSSSSDDDEDDDQGMLREMSSTNDLDTHHAIKDDATTITQDEQQSIEKEVQQLREQLLKKEGDNNKKFEQPGWDKQELEEYDWIRMSDYPEFKLFPGGSAANINASQIKQSEIGDCYLLSVIAVLSHSRRDIIENLFVVKEVNDQCVYAVRLWSAGKWHSVLLDDRFPVKKGSIDTTDNNKKSEHPKLLFASSTDTKSPSFWLPLLEKAIATFHGSSYKNIVGCVSMESWLDLTGLPVKKVRFGGASTTTNNVNNATSVNSPQQLAKQMTHFFKTSCLMAASCGGGATKDANATKMKLRPAHSYSVLRVTSSPQDPSKLFVLCRDPWSSTDAAEVVSKASGITDKTLKDLGKCHDGEFWISIEQFMNCFNLLVVCITHPFAHVVSGKQSAVVTGEFDKSFIPSNLEQCAIEFTVVGKPDAAPAVPTHSMSSITAKLPPSNSTGGAGRLRASGTMKGASTSTRPGGAMSTKKPTSSSASEPLVNLYAMASQPQIRNGQGVYCDLAIMILKLPSPQQQQSHQKSSTTSSKPQKAQQQLPKLIAFSEVAVDRISTTLCRITEPGHYIAFPISFNQQHQTQNSANNRKDLFATLLVEKVKKGFEVTDNALESPFRLVSSSSKSLYPLIYSSANKWLFKYIEKHPDVDARMAQNNFWDLFKWSHGLLRASMVRALPNQNNAVSTISIDTKGSVHTNVPLRSDFSSASSSSDDEENYEVVLAPKQCAIVHLSVPLPWNGDEGKKINSAIAWNFKTKTGGSVPEFDEKRVARFYKSF